MNEKINEPKKEDNIYLEIIQTLIILPIALCINLLILNHNIFSVYCKITQMKFNLYLSIIEFGRILKQFPFPLTQFSEKKVLDFIDQLKNLRVEAPINPYTGFPVFLLSFVTLAQFKMSMNYFCSLSQIHFDSKYLLLVTTDLNCYTAFKKYNIRIYHLDLSNCSVNYFGLTKVKIIVSKILLLLNYECLLSDIDIEYFDSFYQYLLCPKTFDIGFWYEGGTIEVTNNTLYHCINTGFTRFFPTKESLFLIDKWMIENQKHQSYHDQSCIQNLMKNKSVISCSYFELDKSYALNKKGYWNCQIGRKNNFIYHIFPERKMVSGCELLYNSSNIISFKKNKIVPTIFHLICLMGEPDKKQFLDKSELWFYNATSNKCIAKNAIDKWNHFFNSDDNSILKIPFKSTQKVFPAVHINVNISNIIINDEIVKMLTSRS